MKDNIPSGLKSKQEIYFEATHKQMGNADGTRMDVIFEAMQMYADQFQPPSSTSVKVEELANDSASLHLKKVGTHDRPDITEHDFIEGFKAGFLAASDELNLLTETIKNQHELILSGEKRGYEKAKEEFAASPKGKEEERRFTLEEVLEVWKTANTSFSILEKAKYFKEKFNIDIK